jgi:hypothetical protein
MYSQAASRTDLRYSSMVSSGLHRLLGSATLSEKKPVSKAYGNEFFR